MVSFIRVLHFEVSVRAWIVSALSDVDNNRKSYSSSFKRFWNINFACLLRNGVVKGQNKRHLLYLNWLPPLIHLQSIFSQLFHRKILEMVTTIIGRTENKIFIPIYFSNLDKRRSMWKLWCETKFKFGNVWFTIRESRNISLTVAIKSLFCQFHAIQK